MPPAPGSRPPWCPARALHPTRDPAPEPCVPTPARRKPVSPPPGARPIRGKPYPCRPRAIPLEKTLRRSRVPRALLTKRPASSPDGTSPNREKHNVPAALARVIVDKSHPTRETRRAPPARQASCSPRGPRPRQAACVLLARNPAHPPPGVRLGGKNPSPRLWHASYSRKAQRLAFPLGVAAFARRCVFVPGPPKHVRVLCRRGAFAVRRRAVAVVVADGRAVSNAPVSAAAGAGDRPGSPSLGWCQLWAGPIRSDSRRRLARSRRFPPAHSQQRAEWRSG
jgi:hypothetical protein